MPSRSGETTTETRTARPRTGASTLGGLPAHHVICAVIESRGVSPTVGLAFVNVDTCEVVLCEICDSQTYVHTVHKLQVYSPTEILLVSTSAHPKSKLFSIIEEEIDDIDGAITLVDRRYWSETAGMDYVQELAFRENVEVIKTVLHEKYFAVCCLSAVGSTRLSAMSTKLMIIGHQVCRTLFTQDIRTPFGPDPIRAVRRDSHDWRTDHSLS